MRTPATACGQLALVTVRGQLSTVGLGQEPRLTDELEDFCAKEHTMTTDAIVDLVQQRTGQDSPEIAERLIQYGNLLLNPDEAERGQFSAEEFVHRVAQRSDISVAQSETWTRAGLTAIIENTPTQDRNRFVAALPEDLTHYTEWIV